MEVAVDRTEKAVEAVQVAADHCKEMEILTMDLAHYSFHALTEAVVAAVAVELEAHMDVEVARARAGDLASCCCNTEDRWM